MLILLLQIYYHLSQQKLKIQGLVLLASYSENDSLLNKDKEVISLWGSNYGILNFESFEESKSKLPVDIKFIEIQGANHSQFGDYGLHKNFNPFMYKTHTLAKILLGCS